MRVMLQNMHSDELDPQLLALLRQSSELRSGSFEPIMGSLERLERSFEGRDADSDASSVRSQASQHVRIDVAGNRLNTPIAYALPQEKPPAADVKIKLLQ